MKIGIYGGSFNPPHLGHMAAARAAVEALKLDKLVFVPAGDPPHKELAPGSPSPEKRLEMTALAADQLLLPKVTEVWDVEVERQGKSFTSDTLAEAAERWPGDELWLLVGTDMFLTLHTWHEPERILKLAGVCAFARSLSDDRAELEAQKIRLERDFGAKVELIAIPGLVEISSTQLRVGLSQGEHSAALDPAVYGFILREKLYGTEADLTRLNIDDLRRVSWSMVKAKRLAHIRGTEETAAALARRWGADEDVMRRAAILHDCTKYWTLKEHLALCDRYHEPLDELERSAEKLLHSKSGAVMAKYVFGQEDAVVEAIRYHTTARAGMSLEEKLLYLADYIEPNRAFPEVEELRKLAFEDLDGAVAMGAWLSIQEMEERNRIVHRNTVEAYTYYTRGKRA